MGTFRPIVLAGDRDLWEQQPDESDRMHGWFVVYRNLGRSRTLAKVAEKIDKSADYVRQLSARYQWKDRVRHWDAYQDTMWELEVQDARREMVRKQVAMADRFMTRVEQRLETLDPAIFTPADVARWFDIAVKVTRAAYGVPDTTVAVSSTDGGPVMIDMTQMGVKERRERFEELKAELDRRLQTYRRME